MLTMSTEKKHLVLSADEIDRAISRISHEILERNRAVDGVVLIGIRRRGITLARRIAQKILERYENSLPVGEIDVTHYRDDRADGWNNSHTHASPIPFPVHGKTVILVDDVLFTGRTVRAAMDGLITLGRPRSIQLAVLLDRGHRELPIRADYVGKNIPTPRQEIVEVHLYEDDGCEKVTVQRCDETQQKTPTRA